MTEPAPDDLDRLRALFAQASRLPEAERAAFVEAECADHPALRAEVLELLGFVDAPHPALRRLAGQLRVDELDAPEEIGGFEILEVLGRGGMGVVYRARQRSPRREVALKLLQPGFVDPSMLRRFVHETEVLGTLSHPCIAKLFDAGTFDTGFGELPWFVMELVEGVAIDAFVRSHQLDAAACCRLLIEVCHAIQHAHERGVVHRDLKPGNLLVGLQGGRPSPRVLDFGIARSSLGDEASRLTRSGQLFGTLPYMSPEQLDGDSERVDGRTDVYSLGVLLFELLTGRLPLDVADRPLTDALRILREEEPPRLRALRPDLPRDLDAVVGCAMAPDASARYPSARALAEDLERFLAQLPVRARPPSRRDRALKFARRNRALVAGVAGTIAALVVGLAGMTFMAVSNERLAERQLELQLELRERLYSAQMSAAGPLLTGKGAPRELAELVARWPAPLPGEPELRGWEYELAARQAALLEGTLELRANVDQLLSVGDTLWVVAAGGLWTYDVERARALDERLPGGSARKLRLDPTARFAVWLDWGEDRLRWGAVDRLEEARGAPAPDLESMEISPDGRWIAGTSGGEYRVRVLDGERGELAWEGPADRPGFDSFAFEPDGSRLYYADRAAGRVHAVETRGFAYAWSRDLELPASQLALSPDGALLAAGLIDGTCVVIDLASGAQVRTGERGPGAVRQLAWSADGRQLGLSHEDGALVLARADTGCTTRLPVEASGPLALAFHGDGQSLFAAGYAGRLQRFRTRGELPVRRFEQPRHDGGPTIQWSADGSFVVLGRSGAAGRLFDARTGGFVAEVEGWLAPDGRSLLRQEADELVLRRLDGAVIARRPWSGLLGICWSPEGERVLVLGSRQVAVLDSAGAGWAEAALLPAATPHTPAWSPDGSRYAYVCWESPDQGLYVRDAESGERLGFREAKDWGGELPSTCAWLPDGALLRLGFEHGDERLFDPATGEWRGSAPGGLWQPRGNRAVHMDPAGMRVVDRERGHAVLVVPELRGVAAWSPDGSRLAIATDDGPAWIWSVR